MNWQAIWRTLTEPEQVGEMRRLRAEEAHREKMRLRPHHLLCNGDPRSPVEGCRWCDGAKGLWAEARKYHQTNPPSGRSRHSTLGRIRRCLSGRPMNKMRFRVWLDNDPDPVRVEDGESIEVKRVGLILQVWRNGGCKMLTWNSDKPIVLRVEPCEDVEPYTHVPGAGGYANQ